MRATALLTEAASAPARMKCAEFATLARAQHNDEDARSAHEFAKRNREEYFMHDTCFQKYFLCAENADFGEVLGAIAMA